MTDAAELERRQFVVSPRCCDGDWQLIYDSDSGLWWLRCAGCGAINPIHHVTGPLMNVRLEDVHETKSVSGKPRFLDRLLGRRR